MSKSAFILLIIMLFSLATSQALAVDASQVSKKKQTQLGLYLTSKEAYEKIQQDGQQVLFLDVRTRAEINFLGMATVADANVPYMKLSEWYAWDAKKNNFKMELNDEFLPQVRDKLADKNLGEDATIIVMCRSGKRSAAAANLLAKAGFRNVYTVVDGFEGDKAKSGANKGQRVVNGWKNNGLPWSYKLMANKMFLGTE